MKTKEELKLYFENGDKPTQNHFWELQDSYWHKEEKISKESLDLNSYDEIMYSTTDSTEVIGIGKKIVFPNGAKTIEGFMYAPAAKNYILGVEFPNSLEKLKVNAFSGQYITGTLKIPHSCKVIERYAFYSTVANISELILEEGLETIGDNAFQLANSKNLTSLIIPSSVRSIGQGAFTIPSLKTVSAPTGLDLTNAGIPNTAIITYR